MRKLLLLLIIAGFVGTVSARTIRVEVTDDEVSEDRSEEMFTKSDPNRFRTKYFNFNYSFGGVYLPVEWGGDVKIGRGRWGTGFSTGQSYIVTGHEPIAGLLRVGIDVTWMDFNVNCVDVGSGLLGEAATLLGAGRLPDLYMVDLGIGVGPSLHISPLDGLFNLHFYGRYNPTFAVMTGREFGALGGYSSVIVAGGAISFNVVSIGIEGRWGFGSYGFFGDDRDDFDPMRLRTKGGRVYLGFRF